MFTQSKKLILLSLALLGSCSVQEKTWESTSPIFISEKTKEYIQSTKVIVSIDQDTRLGIPILGQRTSHQYYGVLGKLAESAEIRFADDLSDSHRALLRTVDKAAFRFDTGAKFRDAVESSLQTIKWLKVSSVTHQHKVPLSDLENMVKTQDEDAMLLIDNRYLMAFDFSSISVFSYVTLYAHSEELIKIANAAHPYEEPPTLYKKLFSFEFRFKDQFTTADDALKGWSTAEGKMVADAISQSITDLTEQIVSDLSFTTIDK